MSSHPLRPLHCASLVFPEQRLNNELSFPIVFPIYVSLTYRVRGQWINLRVRQQMRKCASLNRNTCKCNVLSLHAVDAVSRAVHITSS